MSLLTSREVADRLGMTRRSGLRYRRLGMPGPVVYLEGSALYDWHEVESWAVAHERYDDVVDMATPFPKGWGGLRRATA